MPAAQVDGDETFILSRMADVFTRRVKRAPRNLRIQVYGQEDLCYGFWSFRDHAILSIDDKKTIEEVHARTRIFDHPYPGLVAGALSKGVAPIMRFDSCRNFVVANLGFQIIGGGCAVELLGESSISFISIRVTYNPPWRGIEWFDVNSVYVVSFGNFILYENCYEYFDDLIAKHIAEPIERK